MKIVSPAKVKAKLNAYIKVARCLYWFSNE
jgi:hypothetical protein